MKNVTCLIFLMLIYGNVGAERLTVHVNDSWEYSYEKRSEGYSETGPLQNEIMTGIIVLKIDSIITNPDHDTILYVTKSDSMQIKTRSGSSTIKTSRQLSYKISGDTVVEIFSGGTTSSKQPFYFAYWQLPDTSWELSTQRFERKTIVKDTLLNSTSSKMRSQISLSSNLTETADYIYSKIKNDTLVWLDSIGLFKQVSNTSDYQHDEKLHSLISMKSIERFTLMKRNGKGINQYGTGTVSRYLKLNNGCRAKTMYYSLNGCLHTKPSATPVTNRLIIQINPDHHSGAKKILQLCK